MARLALTRLASLVGIFLGLSVVVFLLEAVVPADSVRAMVGAAATPQIVEAKRHELGLDRPLPAQYAHFLSRAVRGDLSMSLSTRRPVRPTSPPPCQRRWSLRRPPWCWPWSWAGSSAY